MTFKTALFAAILAAAPTFALSMGGCSFDHSTQQVSSCADGFVWDSASETCVAKVTS